MPPKRGKTAEKKVLPPFYAFGKLDKKGKISDKKGAAALAKASVTAGNVLLRLIQTRTARFQHADNLKHNWETSALDIQRTWRGHCKRGIARWQGIPLDINIVIQRATTGHVRCSTDLQRVWRGHVQRKRVAFGDTPKWHEAAAKLQRLYRGSVTRQLAKQLKYVRCVPAATMLVAMAVLGDSGALRRRGAGKWREQDRVDKIKPDDERMAAARPVSTQPITQANVARSPAGPNASDGGESNVDDILRNDMEREVARAMELSQLFLALTPDNLDVVFNCMDVTSQGQIRRVEVEKAARSAQLGDFCVDMFFALADSNGDGVVDRKEYDDALGLTRLFLAGHLRDQNQDTDKVAMAKIEFLQKEMDAYDAEVGELIAQLTALRMKDRVPAIFALSKRDRIRIARVDRGLIQDASIHMDKNEQRQVRIELGQMGDEADERRDLQASITKLEEDITFNQYFVLRSPCRQRQLSRAQLAALEAERLAAEEAARQAQLGQPALLRLSVLRARGIRAADVSLINGSSSDPYVALEIGNLTKKTRVKKQTLNPEWNERFDLVLHAGLRRENLWVECFDFDKIGADDSLGHVSIALEPLVHNKEVFQWYPLQSNHGGQSQGEIELRYRLLVQSEEEAAESARAAARAEAAAMLEVTILRGADLLAADRGGTSDPYVRILVGDAPKTSRKTSVKKKTLQPEWNQTFKIRLDSKHRRQLLAFECFDYDVLGGDDSLGRVEIPLEALVLDHEYKEWHALQHANGFSKGELQVRYRLSLRNQSTTPAILHVTAFCARGLLAADRGGTSDPYVRLHVGDAVREARKTKVKKKTLSPAWNHRFKFRLFGSERQDDLTVECFDYDFLNPDDSLGKVIIPIDSLHQNQEYTEWHKLIQEDGSVGEIKLGYKLEEKTAEQVQADFETLRPGSLTLTVIRAKGLLPADSNGLSDPFLQLTVGDGIKDARKTKVLKRTLNPEWNETFSFELSRAQRQDYLTLECFDWDMLSKNDSLGAVDLPLDALVFNQEHDEWHKLEQEGETEHHGEIQIRYFFKPSLHEDFDVPIQRAEAPPVVTFTPGPASLEITIICAKNLMAADRGGTSDPYVRLHLANELKTAQKTKVIKKTLAPEWNETFSFVVDSSRRRENVTIECFDYDLLGSDDSLGKCEIDLAPLAPDYEYSEWLRLGQDDEINRGQVMVRYKLQLASDLNSTVSLPLPLAPRREPSTSLNESSSLPVDTSALKQSEFAAESESAEVRQLEDAKERMMLSSCSLFRLVVHPLALPSIHDKTRSIERLKTLQQCRTEALLEVKVAMREAGEKFENACDLLGRGHFQEAARVLNLSQLCYEYADNIEREANVFFDLQSNLVLFDEGAGGEIAKITQIENLHEKIETMFKDSMRGVWPLHVAASNGAVGTVRYLINKLGERVDAVDRAGKTALHVAVESGRVDVVRVLMEDFGADSSLRTFTGRTPMHIASDNGDADMVRGLFEGCAALIAKQIAGGLRARLSNEQISEEALKMLGTWNETDHGNSALALAAHKIHEDTLEVYSMVRGLQSPEMPSSRKSSRSVGNKSNNDILTTTDGSLDHPDNISMHSGLSMDDEDKAEANAKLLRTLGVEGTSSSQNMATFPACLHWTRAPDLEADLMLEFERKEVERGLRVALRSRPVSASSGSEGSIGSPITDISHSSEKVQKLAMLRGEFHVRLCLVEARDLRARKQNMAPNPCVDLDWLPAGHHEDPVRVHERTRILHGTITPSWNAVYEFDVDPDGPDGWSYLTLVVRDVHKDTHFEDFLGTVTIDMSDLVFGVTQGWYDLQDNVDLRGSEVFAKNRLRLGKIYPMRAIQGSIYIEMQATNPVQHLPKPPPQEPISIFEDEVMVQVIQENRGASKKRRRLIVKEMWDRMLADNPNAAERYQQEHSSLIASHVERMNEQLLKSSAEGEPIAIHYCIKQGADANWKDAKNNSALFIAAHCGNYEVTDALINYKADIDFRSDDGATPLYQAAANGHASVIRRLVTAKADVEAKTNNKTTPLNAAARNGKVEGLRALLEEGADVNSRNAMGATSLHLAVFASHDLCVKALLDHGANTKLTIKKGALAGTAPYEMAKTDEIRQLLDAHNSPTSGLFGLLQATATGSTKASRDDLDRNSACVSPSRRS